MKKRKADFGTQSRQIENDPQSRIQQEENVPQSEIQQEENVPQSGIQRKEIELRLLREKLGTFFQ